MSGIGLVGALALLAGCTGSLNTSDELLGAPPLPALGPTPDVPPHTPDEPSLVQSGNGLDRRGWTPVAVVVPRGQVEHQPTYWTQVLEDHTTARQRGEAPRGTTALEGFGDGGAAALESSANLVATPAQLVASPVEMVFFGQWPWVTVRNHPTYERRADAPAADPWRWITPPATPSPPAVPLP